MQKQQSASINTDNGTGSNMGQGKRRVARGRHSKHSIDES